MNAKYFTNLVEQSIDTVKSSGYSCVNGAYISINRGRTMNRKTVGLTPFSTSRKLGTVLTRIAERKVRID